MILRAALLSPARARGCEIRETASSDLELGLVTELDSVRDEWEALACAAGNPFLTPQWAETWLRLCGECCEPRVFAARRGDGGLAAIVPLVIVRGRYARKARFLGFGPANELGPLLAPADAALAPDLLRRAVTAIRREWDVFLAEKLPGQGWAQRVGGVTMARKAAPLVTGPWESWDAYLASRSRDFRQELRRKERRLQERGLRYLTVGSPAELDSSLDVLFRLHRATWAETAFPSFAGREPFHRAFARLALERGWLRLHILELAQKPVAAYYGFRIGQVEWGYQFGRDRAEDRASVGAVIAGHAIRESIAEGAGQFRLGPGAQAYKTRLATDDPGVETIGLADGLRGHAVLRASARRAAAA